MGARAIQIGTRGNRRSLGYVRDDDVEWGGGFALEDGLLFWGDREEA